ncbi:calponin homology domain-containing protein [Pelagophyceae sp. CCMP2097]|nr:calponin homology domain-containing protein [Pelagophyceae sp. CCMP2097]
MPSDPDEPAWLRRQRKLFTNFCNAKLCERDDVPPVTDVFEDIKDGRLLYALLEELSGQSLAPLGKIARKRGNKPMTRIDHVANLSISFRYIKQTTKIVGIGPGDVADGNPSLILGLLWSIIVFFTAKDLGGVDDVSALKKKILKWCQKRTEKNPDVDVRNLKDSFMGGRAFLAILADVDPAQSPYEPCSDSKVNYKRAFSDAAARYGVPELLDEDDDELWKDEQAMVTYLGEMMKRLPEPGADPTLEPLKFVDDHFDQALLELADLCKLPSIPGDAHFAKDCEACAQKLAALMEKAGFVGVSVDAGPAGGAPFVSAHSPKFDKALATVLLVAEYGVDDPALCAVWTSAPFSPVQSDGRLKCAGSASTKGGAVAMLKAVQAIVATVAKDAALPVNVDFVAACGSAADYASGGRVEHFLKERYASPDRAFPDYVVVDAPACGRGVAAGKFAVALSCRGDCAVECSVGLAAKAVRVGEACGPLLDAHMALCKTLASLRENKTAKLNVPGLDGFKPGTSYERNLANVDDVDAHGLAARCGYAVPPNAIDESAGSVAARLCFQPGLSVVSLHTQPCAPGELAAQSAKAEIYASLAPAFCADEAAAAIAAACARGAPWGAAVTTTQLRGRTGFVSHSTPLLAKVEQWASKHFEATRGKCAVVGSPAFLPLPAAVARALPKSAMLAVGVDDADAKLGCDGEAVSLLDLKAQMKTFVGILMAFKQGLPKRVHAEAVDSAVLFDHHEAH